MSAPPYSGLIMNGRILHVPSNGQARVAAELNRRLRLPVIAPPTGFASGAVGHLWEQTVMVAQLHGRPLWSPSTSAPIAYCNQIATIHDIAFVDAPQFFAPRFAAVHRFIVRRVVRIARHLVTVSDFTRRRLIERYGLAEDRVTTVHVGVADAFFVRQQSEVDATRVKFGLAGVPYLMAFSGADPRKNTHGVLRAWSTLGSKRGDGKLVLFGRNANPAVFNVSREESGNGDVVRIGDVPDDELACLLTGAQGLVFPSFYEGFGLPVIEAAASGAPVVTSNVASLPEIAPKDAVLVDPSSQSEITEAMLTLLKAAPDAAARNRGAAAIRSRFSWDAAADAYRAIFARTFG